jgi:hypothetical protein
MMDEDVGDCSAVALPVYVRRPSYGIMDIYVSYHRGWSG